MKKILLLALTLSLSNTLLTAQDLSSCKNICKKERIIQEGPFLGVRIITDANNQFAKVLEVVPNTAAAKNNFAVGDVITKVDGINIANHAHLIQVIKAHQPNDVVKITYLHNNKSQTKKIALGALRSRKVIETVCCDDEIAASKVETKTTMIEKNNISFSLYPNPAVNTLQISSDESITGETKILVLDLLGNEIMSSTVKNNGVMNHKMNIETLASGTYLIKIEHNNIISSKKLIVAK